MRDEVFTLRAVTVGVIGQAGDFAHQQIDVTVDIPHAVDILRVGKRIILHNDLGAVGGVVQAADVRRKLGKDRSHTSLHRGVLGQQNAAAGHGVVAQQIQQVTDVVAAVRGCGLQQVGFAAVDGAQVALEDFGFGQAGGLDGRIRGMHALAQGLGGVPRAANNHVGMCDFVFYGFRQHIPARQDAAPEQHHNIHLRRADGRLHGRLR